MEHDSSTDPRLWLAEKAVTMLQENFKQKLPVRPAIPKQKIQIVLSEAKSAVKSLRYSYQASEELIESELTKKIVNIAKEILNSIISVKTANKEANLALNRIEWATRVLIGLKDQLKRKISSLGATVELKVAQVRNIASIQKSKGKLVVTRVYDGERILTIVTNLVGVKIGVNLPIALVPPSEVSGVISEAMFLRNTVRSEPVGAVLGEKDVDVSQVEAVLRRI